MKKSDIKIDNNFTTVANVALCKQTAADFCERFTNGDILRAVDEAAPDKFIDTTAEVISANAEIYCSAPIMATTDDVQLVIHLFLFGFTRAWRIIVYCDANLKIREDHLTVTKYEEVR